MSFRLDSSSKVVEVHDKSSSERRTSLIKSASGTSVLSSIGEEETMMDVSIEIKRVGRLNMLVEMPQLRMSIMVSTT